MPSTGRRSRIAGRTSIGRPPGSSRTRAAAAPGIGTDLPLRHRPARSRCRWSCGSRRPSSGFYPRSSIAAPRGHALERSTREARGTVDAISCGDAGEILRCRGRLPTTSRNGPGRGRTSPSRPPPWTRAPLRGKRHDRLAGGVGLHRGDAEVLAPWEAERVARLHQLGDARRRSTLPWNTTRARERLQPIEARARADDVQPDTRARLAASTTRSTRL